MANQRTFQVQGLELNGVAIGGLATIQFNATYGNVIESASDGAIGAEDVDRAGLAIGVTISCTDVTKVNAALVAAVGNTIFWGKESGAATYHKYTVPGIVLTGMNLNLSKVVDATLQLTGRVRLADGAKDLDDVLALTAADAGAAMVSTYPARLYRPNTASFDPEGADPAIAPIHVESVGLSLAANVLEDFSDTDIGMTAVDIGGWRALQVTLGHRDTKAESPSHINAKLMGAARGVLTVVLLGRAGAANKTLTANNLLWTGSTQQDRADYSEFTLAGGCGWKAGATTYAINTGDKLFSFA